jgi:transcription elongation factor Elf1
MEDEILETQATTYLEIYVTCPYCGDWQNRVSDLTEHLSNGELRAEECDAELKCENEECGKRFLVTSIEF